MPKMKISVLKADIKKGEIASFTMCPIARAIKRQCKSANIEVGRWRITNKQSRRSVNLPVKAQRFIEKFDNSLLVKPFEFTLPVDCSWFKET